MTWIIMFLGLLAAAVLQTALPSVAVLGQAKPPLLLCVALYYALHRGVGPTAAAGAAAGFLQDALSGIPLGYSAFCFCAAVWVAGLFRKLVLTESAATWIFFGAATSAAVTLAIYLLLLREGLVAAFGWWTVWKIAASALLGAVSAPVVFGLLVRLERMVGIEEAREEPNGLRPRFER